MRKFLAGLAIMGATSMPAVAQTTTPSTTTPATTNQVQPAKPQMIKKRVCEQFEQRIPVPSREFARSARPSKFLPSSRTRTEADRRQRAPRSAATNSTRRALSPSQSPLIAGSISSGWSMIGLPTSPCPTVRPAISSIRSSGTRARSMTSGDSSIRGSRSRSAT